MVVKIAKQIGNMGNRRRAAWIAGLGAPFGKMGKVKGAAERQ
jgi:hypothetical protein